MTERETESAQEPVTKFRAVQAEAPFDDVDGADGVDGVSVAEHQQPFGFERTGNDVVDSVLASLAGLDDVPVAERVGIFESAHDRLRGALADTDGSANGS